MKTAWRAARIDLRADRTSGQASICIDGRLSQKSWLLGDDYTLVDLIVASVIGYSVYLGAPVAGHPTTQAWLQKVQARPAMQIDA